MADDLTVKSPGAGSSGDAARVTRATVDAAKSRSTAAIDKLRAFVQQRFGRVISQEDAQVLRERIKARRADLQVLSQAKASFEAQQTKEKRGPVGPEQQLRQVLGAAGARGADGLDEKAKAAVRGDLEAGPHLPPIEAKALDAQRAEQIVSKMLRYVLVDDQPVDLAAYAAGLHEEKDGTQKGLGGNRQTSGKQFSLGDRAAALARLRQGAPGMFAPPAGKQAARSPLDIAMSPMANKQAAAESSQRASSAVKSASKAGTGNAAQHPSATSTSGGGRFVSNMKFDGLHFNWDGFFLRFMIESSEDLAVWMKMMRELRNKAAENSLLARRVEIRGLEREADFDELFATIDLTKDIAQACSGYDRGKSMAERRLDAVKSAQEAEKAAQDLKNKAVAEAAKVKEDIKTTQGDLKKSQDKAAAANAQLQKAAEAQAKKQVQLQAAKEKGDTKAEQVLKAELEKASKELDKATVAAKMASSEVQRNASKLKQLQARYEGIDRTLEDPGEVRKQARAEAAKVKADIKTAEVELQQTQENRLAADARRQQAQGTQVKKQAELQAAKEKGDTKAEQALKAEVATAAQEAEEANTNYQKLDEAFRSQASALAALRARQEGIARRIEDPEGYKEELRAEAAKVKAEIKAAETAVQASRQQAGVAAQQAEKLKAELTAKRAALKEAKESGDTERATALQVEVERIEQPTNDAIAKASGLNAALLAKEAELAALRARLEEIDKALAHMETLPNDKAARDAASKDKKAESDKARAQEVASADTRKKESAHSERAAFADTAKLKDELDKAKKEEQAARKEWLDADESADKAEKARKQKEAKLEELKKGDDKKAIAEAEAEVAKATQAEQIARGEANRLVTEYFLAADLLVPVRQAYRASLVADKAKAVTIAAQLAKVAYANDDVAGHAEYAEDLVRIKAAEKRATELGCDLEAREHDLELHQARGKLLDPNDKEAHDKWQSDLKKGEDATAQTQAAWAKANQEAKETANFAPNTPGLTWKSASMTAASSLSSAVRGHLGMNDAHYAQAHNEIIQRLIASPDETRRRVEQLKRRTVAEAQGMLDQLMAIYKSGRVT